MLVNCRLNRREPQSNLTEQQQQKGHSCDAPPREIPTCYGNAESPYAQQVQPQQREFDTSRMKPIAQEANEILTILHFVRAGVGSLWFRGRPCA
jgi:hypothetical protein